MNKDEELAAEKMINVTHSTDKNILGMFFLLYHSDWWLLPVQTGCSTRETDKHIIPPLKNQHGECDISFVAQQESDSPPVWLFKNYLRLWESVK